MTLLDFARVGDFPQVCCSLESGSDPDLVDDNGWTALSFASWKGHEAAVTSLLNFGANPNISNHEDRTPLFWASLCGHDTIVQRLLNYGANPDIGNGETPLYKAVQNGHKTVAQRLLQNGANPNPTSPQTTTTPLHIASQEGNIAMVELLLRHGGNPYAIDRDGKGALEYARDNFNGECVLALEKYLEESSPYDRQEWEGPEDEEMIVVMAGHGRLDDVCQLLNTGIPVNRRDAEGKTALYWASCCGQEHVVQFLLNRGADSDIANKNGDTPLYGASCHGRESVVRLLLQYGANYKLANKQGYTPLYGAGYNYRSNIVQLLLDADSPLTNIRKNAKKKEVTSFEV